MFVFLVYPQTPDLIGRHMALSGSSAVTQKEKERKKEKGSHILIGLHVKRTLEVEEANAKCESSLTAIYKTSQCS